LKLQLRTVASKEAGEGARDPSEELDWVKRESRIIESRPVAPVLDLEALAQDG
jgi:hypothetical protein